MTKLKHLISITVILAALIQVVASSETLENVKPGEKTIDLGDGYEVSFVLDDVFEAYDIEVNDPYHSEINASSFFSSYKISIYPKGISDKALDHIPSFSLTIFVTAEPQIKLTPESYAFDKGGVTGVFIAGIIDKSPGSLDHTYNRNKVFSPENATTARFMYYPASSKRTDINNAVDGRISVIGQIPFRESGLSEEYPVFKAILYSIHLTGPGI